MVMYRSEILYESIKDTPLLYSVCIPSYDKVDPAFFKWVSSPKFDIPRENLCVFIRNTPEQKKMYAHMKDRVRILLLPDWVQDIGDTRKAIVQWGAKHSPDLIYMLDDRVDGIWWLNTQKRPSGICLDVDERSTPKTAFQIWGEQHLSAGMVATSISNKGFHWMPDRINMPIKPLNGGGLFCCIAISPAILIKTEANYDSIRKTGVEDVFITYQLLTRRLPFCSLSDICYSQVKTTNVGGNASTMPGVSRNDRLLIWKKTFWESTLGIPWDQKHPGYYRVSTKTEPDQIRINYSYWRKYYDNSE